MSDALNVLLNAQKLSKHEYDTFVLYELSDVGRSYLKDKIESLFMEEPAAPVGDLFVWHSGRCSVFRDIKRIIDHVYKLLEDLNND